MDAADKEIMKQFLQKMFATHAKVKSGKYKDPATGTTVKGDWVEPGDIDGGWSDADLARAYKGLMDDMDAPAAMSYKDKKKAIADNQKLYKQAYEGYLDAEGKTNRMLQDVVAPAASTALKTGGGVYGLYHSGLAAMLNNAAKTANHSAVGTTARERLAEIAAAEAAKGGVGALLGNAAGGLVDTIAENKKKRADMAAAQAYADVNDQLSGNYWNLAAKTAQRG